MAQFLLSVWHDDDHDDDDVADDSDERARRLIAQVGAFNDDLDGQGSLLFAGGLQPPGTATVLQPTGGDVATTSGPYGVSTRHLGGFWVIEVDDLDAALDWGRRAALACEGPVEVRPFQTD